MAYKAKRQDRVIEDLELCGSDGKVVKTIHVELDADNMVRKLSEKHVALNMQLKNVQEIKDASTAVEKASATTVLGMAGVRFV